MDQLGVFRGRSRWLAPVFFAAALLCFLLPFATVGCDTRATADGKDFLAGHVPAAVDANGQSYEESSDAEEMIKNGAPTVTLAFVFAAGGSLLAVAPGVTAAAAAFAAGAFAVGALALFLLTGYLRLEGAVVDLRYGFWLAAALAGAGTFVALRRRREVAGHGRRSARRALEVAAAGGVVLLIAAVVPHVSVGTEDSDTVGPFLSGLPHLFELTTGARGTFFWAAVGAIGTPFLVVLAYLVLSRGFSVRAAWFLIGLGLGSLLGGVHELGSSITLGQNAADGTYLLLAGSGLVLAGGGLAARVAGQPANQAKVSTVQVLLTIAGGLAVVAGTIVPFDEGQGGKGSQALLEFDVESLRWFALEPLAPGLAAVAALLLAKPQAAGALLGIGAALVFFFTSFLYPAFADSGEFVEGSTLGAGAVIGDIGASLIALAGVAASSAGSRRRVPAPVPP